MFRDKIRELKTPSEQPYRALALGFLNESVLQNSNNFWFNEIKKRIIWRDVCSVNMRINALRLFACSLSKDSAKISSENSRKNYSEINYCSKLLLLLCLFVDMLDQFPYCLTADEQKISMDLRLHVDWKMLFTRFQELTCITFTQKAEELLFSRAGDGNIILLEPDIKKVGVKVSHLPIIHHAGIKSRPFSFDIGEFSYGF